jgi:hypothetical protein
MSLPLGLGCLVEKRAELTGEIRQLEGRLEQESDDRDTARRPGQSGQR